MCMFYEFVVVVWENSFLCVLYDSLLKLSWLVFGLIRGKECLEVRRIRINMRGYYFCGILKFNKIGELNFI